MTSVQFLTLYIFSSSGANSGEVKSFTTAEMRLQSDSAIARGSSFESFVLRIRVSTFRDRSQNCMLMAVND